MPVLSHATHLRGRDGNQAPGGDLLGVSWGGTGTSGWGSGGGGGGAGARGWG
jgi:hypothetical protein